jgi:hypothetical protein
MTPEEIEAIVGGYHGDPFRILGPHAVRKRGGQPRWDVHCHLVGVRRQSVGAVRSPGLGRRPPQLLT